MQNTLVPNNDFIELIKPEAARLLGVDKSQLFVDFKQVRLHGDSDLGYENLKFDLEPKNRIGFLLGVCQALYPEDSGNLRAPYMIKDAHKDWVAFYPMFRNTGSRNYPVSPMNIFFFGFDISVPDYESGHAIYVTYLEFRTL